jgi:uncharacterized membrane protein (DUF485 family)
MPATPQTRAQRQGLVDVQFLCTPTPGDLQLQGHRASRFITPFGLCIIPCCIAAAALAACAHPFMQMRIGPVNGACLLAFTQLLIAWIVAALYIRAIGIFAPIPAPISEESSTR